MRQLLSAPGAVTYGAGTDDAALAFATRLSLAPFADCFRLDAQPITAFEPACTPRTVIDCSGHECTPEMMERTCEFVWRCGLNASSGPVTQQQQQGPHGGKL